MIFNSGSFLIFFLLFFAIYWLVLNRNLSLQNLFVLAGSYVFYAWTDWRILSFLVSVSALNFFLGIGIERAKILKRKKFLLGLGLLQGIGGLIFFKYYNFFMTSCVSALQSLHFYPDIHALNIAIPLGISFFTFKTISYLIDVERGKIGASKDWIVFFSYMAFFPTVFAGPIDSARTFIPQLEKGRRFHLNKASDGLYQVIWGLFKKVVIADNCSTITNQIFDNYTTFDGSVLFLGAFYYTIQIYADFSGYSDMAIGFGRLLGFNVSKNFDFPFFSQNIAEFWRKWHITLTSWLTEYLFTPLSIALRDFGKLGLIFAILINFTIIGAWHGASLNFVLFGFLHGLFFIPYILRGSKKRSGSPLFKTLVRVLNTIATFIIVMLTFVIFKTQSVAQAFAYYRLLLSGSLFSHPIAEVEEMNLLMTLAFIIMMLSIEWFHRKKEYGMQIDGERFPILRRVLYYVVILSIIFFGVVGQKQFIYFNF